MMDFRNNKLMAQFKACGRLLNEWRDTVGYMGVIAGATIAYAQTGDFTSTLINTSAAVVGREMVRSVSWRVSRPMILAGDLSSRKIDPIKFSWASLVGVCGGLVGFCFSLHNPENFNLLGLGTGLVFGFSHIGAGGKNGVVESYKTMWDWPRKRDGDGGQTAKLKKGVRDLMRKVATMVDRVVPDLSLQRPVPVRIPVRYKAGCVSCKDISLKKG